MCSGRQRERTHAVSFYIFTLRRLIPAYFWDTSHTLYVENETCDIAKLYFEVAFSSTSCTVDP